MKTDKLPRPERITQCWIDRNKKRLQKNIAEINRQLGDIENAWEWPEDKRGHVDDDFGCGVNIKNLRKVKNNMVIE